MIKKNILGIIIVILIAGAFATGYLLGRRSGSQMRFPGQRPMMGDQSPASQQGNVGQGRPMMTEQHPTAQQESSEQEARQEENPGQGRAVKADPPSAEHEGASEQRRPMTNGQFSGGQQANPQIQAIIAKAREEGKSREEIRTMIAQLRQQGDSGQKQTMMSDQFPAENTSDAQQPQGQGPNADTSTPAAYAFYGTVVPSAEVNVQSKQGGTIIMLKGKEGDTVKKGELLVRFDDSEQQLQIQKAKSSKNAAIQQVQQAESNLKTVLANVERNQKLFQDGLISQQQMDDLQNTLESARSTLNSANENVNQADTQIALLEKGLEDFVVRAPISGIINAKNYNLKEIYKSSDVIYHVVNIDQVYVDVEIPETYIKQIREAMTVTVIFNAVGDQAFPGIVETILPSSTADNRNFTAKVLVHNPDHAIKPGMFARVEMTLDDAVP